MGWDLKISIPPTKRLGFIAQIHQNSVFFILPELLIYNHENKIN